MKGKYKLALATLILLFLAFEIAIVAGPLGSQNWLPPALQGAAFFVALAAGVIALHSSDRNPPHAKADVHLAVGDLKLEEHTRDSTPGRQWRELSHDISPFHSGRVHFRIKNQSGFTLREPTLSYRLPLNRQHPHRFPDASWAVTFNSNLYNNPDSLRSLQFADTAIISNSNLHFWNDDAELVIWIRMALDAPTSDPFTIEVSLNAENAQGVTSVITIDPKALMGA
jgi:hypothetical protein